mgnify:CR=1 FL=1
MFATLETYSLVLNKRFRANEQLRPQDASEFETESLQRHNLSFGLTNDLINWKRKQ